MRRFLLCEAGRFSFCPCFGSFVNVSYPFLHTSSYEPLFLSFVPLLLLSFFCRVNITVFVSFCLLGIIFCIFLFTFFGHIKTKFVVFLQGLCGYFC
ncbi:hypothetical protein BC829DRAFT_396182, partial [Chytridium lagenaria]